MKIPQKINKNQAYWCGQAGFWIDFSGTRLLIDPYLSDSLAVKYAGTKFPHQRMMPIPVKPQDLPCPDVVLITHAHTDHMDGETLSHIAEQHHDVAFVVPAAEAQKARERIGRDAKIYFASAGDVLTFGKLEVSVLPSYHEVRKQNDKGQDYYLGYAISDGNTCLYHSGDSVADPELYNELSRVKPDIAFLPVNGRDKERADNGVPGNMSASEAVKLCLHCEISHLIAHHFGMFEFNSATEEDFALLKQEYASLTIDLPSPLVPIALDCIEIV
ncbi:MBL fold metallo-hydrolase [Polycladidibacter stylochi]|uniref:MBL fold metallo-hydrolase n=1 Tax=Polycladidibacter stylochi TaxID=1807766 RepID=UPI00082DF65C|nr:MBL fold metallo-hydrolase [Pseudovibrio stylochi]